MLMLIWVILTPIYIIVLIINLLSNFIAIKQALLRRDLLPDTANH